MPLIANMPRFRCTLTLVVFDVDTLQPFELSRNAETSIPSLSNKYILSEKNRHIT